jgi:4-amino-4-deoxy-L-arabinose transferase-like glycosyltransferase
VAPIVLPISLRITALASLGHAASGRQRSVAPVDRENLMRSSVQSGSHFAYRHPSVLKPQIPTPRLIAASLVAVAALLVLPGLGATSLWEDEAGIAVVARNVLHTGLPMASDGRNLVSYFTDSGDVRDGLYIWQPWLQMYLAAGSMAVFGTTAFAARLPFALAFVALVGLSYTLFRRWSGDRQLALIASVLILGSVPLLLHARQARYYLLVPLFSLLVVHAYLRLLKDPSGRRVPALVCWATLLVNSFYPGAAIVALALAVDLAVRRPHARVIGLLAIAAAVVALLNLPMAIYCMIWQRQFGVQPGYSSLETFATYLLRYLLTLNAYFFPFLLFVLAAVLRWCGIVRLTPPKSEVTRLLVTLCLVNLIVVTVLSDYPFSRYLVGMAPFLLYLGARAIQVVSGGRPWLAWSLVALVLSANVLHLVLALPLRASSLARTPWTLAGVDSRFLQPGRVGISLARGEIQELINLPVAATLSTYVASVVDPPLGPIDAIAGYLNEHAEPSDRVKISYGSSGLMFHTDLEIVNSQQVGPPAPEWIIDRRFTNLRVSDSWLAALDRHDYDRIELPVADVQWNNRPDPLYHHFASPAEDLAPSVRLERRRDARRNPEIDGTIRSEN